MRADSPYHYHLLMPDQQLGPYDRRTIVGMHIRKLIEGQLTVQRSDGHHMTVVQLLADRFEMADGESLSRQSASPPASGIWPTFLVDFGGSLMKAGALGFIGKGELRFQGDILRMTANRKSGLMSSRQVRIKIRLVDLASVKMDPHDDKVIELLFNNTAQIEGIKLGVLAKIALEDSDSVKELMELIDLV